MAARTAADGKWVERIAVPGSGWKWVGRRSRWRSASLAARTAADGKWVRTTAQTAANGVDATEWLEMGGEKKPLVMRELGCADGCGRQMGGENCADGCGRRGCKGVAGNGEKKPPEMSEVGCADGCGREMGAENCADGCGQRGGWLEMGGEKKPLVMSELGCADGCGREMGAENSADGCGRRGCQGVAGNGWGEEAAGDLRAWLRGRLRTANGWGELRRRLRTAWVPGGGWKRLGRRSRWRSASLAADGCERPGCNGAAGNGWGEEATGDERAWLHGRLRMATEWLEMGGRRSRWRSASLAARTAADGKWVDIELRGRLRTAWVPGSGWKWVGRRSRWRSASLAARTAADGKWFWRIARTAADGVGAREWLEKPLEIRAWLRGRLRTANGWI